ncbi:MAG: hypothetical protein ACWGOX_16260, partial [Desulforhopalus sp.]
MRKKKKAIQERSIFSTIRVLSLAMILLVVFLLLLGSMLGGRFGSPHQLTLDFVGPLQSAVTRSLDAIATIKNDYLVLWNLRAENKRLQALVDKYLTELGEYREAYSTYLYLQDLLDFKNKL